MIVRLEAIKLLEENIRVKVLDGSVGNDSFGYNTKGKGNKSKNKQWDYIKLKISV